jgi:VWFA-related protein
MKTKALFASLALFCLWSIGLAQTQPGAPPPVLAHDQSQDKDDVVRITTNLVQIDAVVTKNGKTVPDLKAEDFEIFQDGRRQTITSFAYISNIPKTTTSAAPAARADKRDELVPPTPLKPEDARRTVAIVVDDLGLSAESMSDVRRQLRKFVTEQIQPHDLVAIIRTGVDIGALQQFTNDKRLLMRAVEQLRWNPCSRVGVSVLPPWDGGGFGGGAGRGCGGQTHWSTFGSLRFILDAMTDLPGRKSMMVLSDSMPIEDQASEFNGIAWNTIDSYNRLAALRRIAEMAIRRSVVIYSIDTQGLQPTGITAADRFSGRVYDITQQMNATITARGRLLFERRAGGDLIARQTGGFQVKNSNDLKLDRVLEDQSGYYLLGYRPAEETFNRRFHKITAKVTRSGMTLRTRYGFFGYPEEDAPRVPRSKMSLALTSPFGAQEINVEFTSFFANDATAGSFIRSFLYVDAKDLTFETVDGKHEAKIELHGAVFGSNGIPVNQIRHNAVVSLTQKDYEQSQRDGIRIRFDMPARQPNAYQVRVAVRDVASSRVGAAGQFVFVPNLKKKLLAVSGVVLLQGTSESSQTGAIDTSVASPAVRRYLPNSDLYATCEIYNASIDAALKRPNLTIESKLFRDGKRVFTYPKVAVDVANQADLSRILVNLKFRLGPDLEPGHYHLQLAITDEPLKDKLFPAVQWADFEIVKPQ